MTQPADVDSMTLEDAQAEFVTLGGELSTITNRRQALLCAIEAKQRSAAAKAQLGRMTDAEKSALRAELGAE